MIWINEVLAGDERAVAAQQFEPRDSPGVLVIMGLMIIVFLLVGALTRNTSDLAEVASTAIGGIFRNLATMLVAVVVLILLVVAVANGAADPGISTVAPGEQADAPAADPGGPADGDGVAVG